jgi:hypothetical protein
MIQEAKVSANEKKQTRNEKKCTVNRGEMFKTPVKAKKKQ